MPTDRETTQKVLKLVGLSDQTPSSESTLQQMDDQLREQLAASIESEAKKWEEVKRESREEATRHFLP